MRNDGNSTQKEQEKKPFVSAIIVAAGNSTRMRSQKNKLLMELMGMPVIARTLAAFENADLVDEVIVVTREEDLIQIYDIVKYFELSKVSQVITGGNTRQQSVSCGIAVANEKAEYFAIHDGARPLVKPESINSVISDAIMHNAASLGVPIKDTLKQVRSDGYIIATLNRDLVWHVQTPQVFESSIYKKALTRALESGEDFTDDCQLLERTGVGVYMTRGEYSNIKITTLEDIQTAKSILMSSYE